MQSWFGHPIFTRLPSKARENATEFGLHFSAVAFTVRLD